jgi:hypothetical protein
VRQVSDGFLLNMAEVSGALVGLFLVGVFFFVETGLGRLHLAAARAAVDSHCGIDLSISWLAVRPSRGHPRKEGSKSWSG